MNYKNNFFQSEKKIILYSFVNIKYNFLVFKMCVRVNIYNKDIIILK